MHDHDKMPIAEAAQCLGVPEAQLHRWALQGVGPKFQGHPLRREQLLYDHGDLLDWQDDKLNYEAAE